MTRARDYADAGLAPIKLYGLEPDGSCQCGRGEDCPPGNRGKHPVGNAWQRQDVDAGAVDRHLSKGGNVGLRMGEQPDGRRLVALDLDEAGAFDAAAESLGELPATLTARTGSGGEHRLFLWPEDLPFPKNRVRSLPGIDVRGEGSQIVVAPSMHHSGNRYEWLDEREPAALPLAWAEALLAPGAKAERGERIAGAKPGAAGRIAEVVGAIYSTYAAGGRHDLTRGLGGWLARQGWRDADIEAAVAALPSDKVPARIEQALDAARRARAGEPAPGWEVLAERLGEEAPRLESAARSRVFDLANARTRERAAELAAPPRWAGAAEPTEEGPLARRLSFEHEEPPIEYYCEPLRLAPSRGKINLIAGMPGAGKGPLADYLAVSFALGGGQFHCSQRSVLLLDVEGARLTKRRCERIARGMGRDPRELEDALHVVDVSGEDLLSDRFHAALESYGAEVLLLDSYTSAMLDTGADPNKIEFGGLAKMLASLGLLTVAVAHANKAPAAGERPTLAQVAGSYALAAMAATGIVIWEPAPTRTDPEPNSQHVACMRAPETKFEPFDIRFTGSPAEPLGLEIVTAASARRSKSAERCEELAHKAGRMLAAMQPIHFYSARKLRGAGGGNLATTEEILEALVRADILQDVPGKGGGYRRLDESVSAVVFDESGDCAAAPAGPRFARRGA